MRIKILMLCGLGFVLTGAVVISIRKVTPNGGSAFPARTQSQTGEYPKTSSNLSNPAGLSHSKLTPTGGNNEVMDEWVPAPGGSKMVAQGSESMSGRSNTATPGSLAKPTRQALPVNAASSSVQSAWGIESASGPMYGSPASGNPALIQSANTLPVPEGATAPAAFYDSAERPPVQQRVLARIQEEFIDALASPPQGMTSDEIWAAAKEAADRQYIKIFGFQSYHTLNLQAAREALGEKRSAGIVVNATTQD